MNRTILDVIQSSDGRYLSDFELQPFAKYVVS